MELGQDSGKGVISEGDPSISRHIELPFLINGILTSVLYDLGLNASFISSSFTRKHYITAVLLEKLKGIGFIDGNRPSKQVQHKATSRLRIRKSKEAHNEVIIAFIFDIQHNLILSLL
jgi:hypothetical protein